MTSSSSNGGNSPGSSGTGNCKAGSKRERPLGYAEGSGGREPSAKVLKKDTVAICEATLSKLRLGAGRVAPSRADGNLRANPSILQAGKQQHQQHAEEIRRNTNGGRALCQRKQGLVRVEPDSILTNGKPVTAIECKCGPCPCYVCVARDSANVCSHCSRECCEQCSRRCDGCQELFCSICSFSNYNERYDRSFCFDCKTPA